MPRLAAWPELAAVSRSLARAARRETVFYQSQPLEYTLHFRARRSLGFSVRPDGSVHVAAPTGVPLSWVEAQVLRRADWILKHQARFRQRPPAPAGRSYAAGSPHYFQGRAYPLRLPEADAPAVTLTADELVVAAPARADVAALLHAWYARQAPALFAASLARVWPRFAALNLPRPTLAVRQMRSRWGSCTPGTARIRLSLDLVRAAPGCLDYVLLHECCHLRVPDHSAAFYVLQTRLLPDWARWKAELNGLPK